MHYYIDGYNLLFRQTHTGDDLRSQREALVHDLSYKVKITEIQATVVFDSRFQEGTSRKGHLGPLGIIYSDQDQSADDYIIYALKHEPMPQAQTVVTSDNKLAWRARRCLAKTMTVESFLKVLEHRYHNKMRQRMQGSNNKKTRVAKKIKLLPKRPAENSKAEAYTDYYEALFEERYENLQKTEQKKSKGTTEFKHIVESEEARWKKIFENRKDENDNGA